MTKTHITVAPWFLKKSMNSYEYLAATTYDHIEVLAETEKAYQIQFCGDRPAKKWMPKSVCEIYEVAASKFDVGMKVVDSQKGEGTVVGFQFGMPQVSFNGEVSLRSESTLEIA